MARNLVDGTRDPGSEGRSPLERDFRGLAKDPKVRATAVRALQRVMEEFAVAPERVKPGQVSKVTGHAPLMEARANLAKMWFRLLFYIESEQEGDEVRMLTAFAKTSNKIEKGDIDRAKGRLKTAQKRPVGR